MVEKHPTLPLVLIVYHTLLEHTTATGDDSASMKILKARARDYLKLKFEKVNITHHIATLFWPRRRSLKMLDSEQKSAVHTELKLRCAAMHDGGRDAAEQPPAKK